MKIFQRRFPTWLTVCGNYYTVKLVYMPHKETFPFNRKENVKHLTKTYFLFLIFPLFKWPMRANKIALCITRVRNKLRKIFPDYRLGCERFKCSFATEFKLKQNFCIIIFIFRFYFFSSLYFFFLFSFQYRFSGHIQCEKQ